MKKALITGVTGQDGSYLTELLLKKGYEVHGMLRRSSSFNTGRIDHIINDKSLSDRFFFYYGDMTDGSSLNRLLEKIEPDEIYNLADAHVLALGDKAENQILNMEGMRRITIKEMAETIQKLVEKDVEIEFMPARPGDFEGKEASNDKIKRLLGWEPKVDFSEGMEKTIAWYKSDMLEMTD